MKHLVEQAKKKLEKLEPLLTQLRLFKHNISLAESDILDDRKDLDDTIVELAPPGQRAQIEEDQIANLNQLPLSINVESNKVEFQVKFHVKFEDQAMEDQYAELVNNMEQGINMVWNHRNERINIWGQRI